MKEKTTESLLQQTEEAETIVQTEVQTKESYTIDTKIDEVISDPVFGEHGRLIFPVDSGYYKGDTLGTLSLTWYSHIDPEKTVEITNYLRDHAAAGEAYFYDIYTDEELACAGINALEDFILEIGLPVTLRELGVDENTDLKVIADSCAIVPGSYKKLTHEEILSIFRECF